LTYAVASSFPKGVKLLIEAGADVDAGGDNGITALMLAAALNNRTMVNMLLAAYPSVDEQAAEVSGLYLPGANTDMAAEVHRFMPSQPVEGATALWLSARAGHSEVVRLLLQEGANANLEASCEHLEMDAVGGETCGAQRAAELAGHKKTAALFEMLDLEEELSPNGKGTNWKVLLQNMSGSTSE